MKVTLLLVAAFVAACSAEIFFEENFGSGWESRWVSSEKSDLGKFELSAGKFFNDADADKGLQTSQDAKFYGISSVFPEFSNKAKTIYISFRVKFEQTIDCGGGYIKVFPAGLAQKSMTGDSEYEVMFGPDICGPGTKKVHVIFRYKGENLLIKKNIAAKSDEVSHLYTLELNPDNTYKVFVDGKKEESGSLLEDWDFLKPKLINDPKISKPKDWVDEKKINDPEDKKPEDWDQPAQISDPDAEKPADWDDEMDGEWEAPQIDNPAYKGVWKAKLIDNPAYKGEWEHPQVPNPLYEEDDSVYERKPLAAVGIDVWQVKSGTIFDNILITDDKSVVDNRLASFEKLAAGEKAAKDKADAAASAASAADSKTEDAEEDADDEEAGHDEF